MTNSSNRGTAEPYARFIPREELDGFAAWRPDAFGDERRDALGRQRGPAQRRATCRPAGGAPGGLPGRLPRRPGRARRLQADLRARRSRRSWRRWWRPSTPAFAEPRNADRRQRGAHRHGAGAPGRAQRTGDAPRAGGAGGHEAVNAVLLSARHIRVFVHPDDHGAGAGRCRRGAGRARCAAAGRRHARARRLPRRIRPRQPSTRASRRAGRRPPAFWASRCR